MIERDIRALAARETDHPLERLEADIWARVAVREEGRRRSARLLVLQVTLLGIAFSVSALAGYQARPAKSSELSVFSTHTPMNPSTLLAEGNP
jgi:hypothetical protein